MDSTAKYHIFCYELSGHPPQIGFTGELHESHPFLYVRDRIDCGADKETSLRIFNSANDILNEIIFEGGLSSKRHGSSSNLGAIFEELKNRGVASISFRKAGGKPIDGNSRRHAKIPRRAFYFDAHSASYSHTA